MAQGSPINDIFQMRQQGLSNNQIIQNLQRQGYTNTQIFDAMNQADTKMAVEGVPDTNALFEQAPQQPVSEPAGPPSNQALFTAPQELPQNIPSSSMSGGMMADDVKVEELVETIVEEKWTELIRDVNKIIDWKNKVENRLTEIEVKLENLKDSYSDLNKSVLGKINEYDKHIMEVGSNINAMEKVFSKVLPSFTENVNELSRIADKFKGDQ